MNPETYIQPMPKRHRQYAFLLLVGLFLIAIPLLYMYATGYRFDFTGKANFVSTGGMFIAVERTGASIYIDNELVRETRAFRQAFYAQSLNPGTHRVHVQKEGHHTWVKELPVYPHLVTEAQAFNLPIVPQARIISPWQTAGGAVVTGTSTLLASTTQDVFSGTTTAASRIRNGEFFSRVTSFVSAVATTSGATPSVTKSTRGTTATSVAATTSAPAATTTKESEGVRLFESNGEVYAQWVDSRELMPYYYCAEAFEPFSTTTLDVLDVALSVESDLAANTAELLHPVQEVSDDSECSPNIQIDRKSQTVRSFDFFPGSTDFVLMVLEDGVYVVEVDNRAWQNVQPIMLGTNLDARIESGRIYIYDGTFIYEMILE